MGAGNTPSEGRTSGCATLRGQSLDSSPHSTLQKAVRGSPGDNIHRVCPAWASGSKQIASALPGRDTYRDYVMGRVPDRSEASWEGWLLTLAMLVLSQHRIVPVRNAAKARVTAKRRSRRVCSSRRAVQRAVERLSNKHSFMSMCFKV